MFVFWKKVFSDSVSTTKQLFGSCHAPASRRRRKTSVHLQLEGLEGRRLLSAVTSPINYVADQPVKVGDYWADVPINYDPTNRTPTTLFVWSHGCGGSSEWDIQNFSAKDGGPSYITIALDGRDGGCWKMSTDPQRVMNAIADVETHFNIDPQRVVLGGYSSGGDLSYRVALTHPAQIAGVLAANTSPFRDTGLTNAQVDEALAAPIKFHVEHLAHTEDGTYGIANVRSETSALKNAGYPLDLIERPGTHWDNDNGDTGTNHDIKAFLLPHLGDSWASHNNAQAVSFANTNDWGTGFVGNITINNTGATAINGWSLEFDFNGNIDPTPNTGIWNGTVVSHVGNHYVIQNVDWNGFIAPGNSETFGFVATWANSHTTPANFVLTGASNKAPTVATAAKASAAVTTAKSVNLSVQGADDGGAANLRYTWGAVPGATFSINNSNAAKNTTVTFSKAGTYTFTVAIQDAVGLRTSSSVTVMVNQALRAVVVSGPTSVTVGASQQFTAKTVDQFGNTMTTQPVFTWLVTGGGTISNAGMFKAANFVGSATVKATAAGLNGIATVKVVQAVSGTAHFVNTDDWGTGFVGNITINNTGTKAINGWSLEFDFNGNIDPTPNTGIWNGVVVSRVGKHYVIKNATWNGFIAQGASVTLGFVATWENSHTAPTNFVLNGTSIRSV